MATNSWYITKQMIADIYSGAANPGDSHIVIGPWAATSYVTRAALYAPIDFTGMIYINEARLYMAANEPASGFHVKGANEATFYAARKATDFSEQSHGGSGAVGEFNWGNSGDWVVENDIFSVEGGDLGGWPLIGDGVYGYMNITQIVRRWFEGNPNYGLMLYNATNESQGQSSYGKQYFSRHVGGLGPYIWIDYNTNSPPTAPTGLSPTGGTIVHTGTTITISGTANDPDAGDYMTGLHIKIFRGAEELVYEHYDYNTQDKGWSRNLPVWNGNYDYYWRARTRDKDGIWGPSCSNQYFRANTIPGAPSINTSETPSSSIKTLTPTFNITRNDSDSPYGDYMSSYQIHVYRNGAAGSGTFHWDSGQVGTGAGTVTAQRTYNGPALSWNTSYWVYIRTWDQNGAVGGWAVLNFTTYAVPSPISLDPTANETVGNLNPTFSGNRADANHTLASMELEVYEANGTTLKWSTGVTTGGVASSIFARDYTGAILSYATTYGWRVRITGNIGGTSNWTAMQWFVTLAATAATQTAPVGSPITTLTPTFTGGWIESLDGVQIILYESDGITQKWDSGLLASNNGSSYSKVYAGPALLWNTTYKWKIRVRRMADAQLQPYTGLAVFTTETAGQPTLTAPITNSWGTTLTPTFTGNTAGAETITVFRIRLYESDGTSLTWDSGDLAGSGTSFSKVYNGTALIAGRSYKWQARYTKTGGAVGNYSAMEQFHINAAPQSPSGVLPATGAIVVDTLTPTFTAIFADLDLAAWGDFPVQMEIEVRNNTTDALIATQVDTTGLVAGVNSMDWDGTPALAYETVYKWRVRFQDSKNVDGAWSSYNTFKPSQSSSVTITAPDGTINSPQVPVAWNFTSPGSKTQGSYRVRVLRNSDEIMVYDSGTVISASTNHTVPAGYLVNNTEYTFEVTAVDTDGI